MLIVIIIQWICSCDCARCTWQGFNIPIHCLKCTSCTWIHIESHILGRHNLNNNDNTAKCCTCSSRMPALSIIIGHTIRSNDGKFFNNSFAINGSNFFYRCPIGGSVISIGSISLCRSIVCLGIICNISIVIHISYRAGADAISIFCCIIAITS